MSEQQPTYGGPDMDAIHAVAPVLGALAAKDRKLKELRENPHQFCDHRYKVTGRQMVYLRLGAGTVMFKLGCYESLRDAIASGTEPQASMARFIHRSINQKAGIDR